VNEILVQGWQAKKESIESVDDMSNEYFDLLANLRTHVATHLESFFGAMLQRQQMDEL